MRFECDACGRVVLVAHERPGTLAGFGSPLPSPVPSRAAVRPGEGAQGRLHRGADRAFGLAPAARLRPQQPTTNGGKDWCEQSTQETTCLNEFCFACYWSRTRCKSSDLFLVFSFQLLFLLFA